ncbi:extracellular solute-binding protein [Paenibacillus doosanensis]|uniref:ABC transporter substrate-binding protein n=1 Tax=Paenibacillus doosanensis TaxID=1229154 RepID=UPI0021803469|nr:extracellular solute-binding protein [Paenibacillus doosanensis]MCS7464366.1 extracellular solute-binding protein [Paenibacillus doosanensis]
MAKWPAGRRAVRLWMAAAVMTAALSGCGGGGKEEAAGEQAGAKEDLNAPVTLIFKSDFGDDQEAFDKKYGNKIKEKFPNVTVQFLPREQGVGINELITSGVYPDIMIGNTSNIDSFLINPGLAYDMSGLIKSANYDLDRFEPTLIEQMRNTNPKGELYGLPMPYGGMQVLFYNKGLFDKFGVPYPTDGMTWDEVYELAKKMTRVDGGQVYRGFSSFIGAVLRDNQLSVSYLDPKADKLNDTEKWKRLLENLGRFYQIPNNNRDPKKRSQTEESGAFMKNMNVAMMVNQFGQYTGIPEEIDWDMAAIPTFKEAPDTGTQINSAYWFITRTNEHKDISFAIISYLLSDEVQALDAKQQATVPSLKSANAGDAFRSLGQDVPALQGKNVKALFYHKPAAAPPKRDPGLVGADPNKLKVALETAFNQYTLDNVDMNTVLRQTEEAVQKLAEEKKNNQQTESAGK